MLLARPFLYLSAEAPRHLQGADPTSPGGYRQHYWGDTFGDSRGYLLQGREGENLPAMEHILVHVCLYRSVNK